MVIKTGEIFDIEDSYNTKKFDVIFEYPSELMIEPQSLKDTNTGIPLQIDYKDRGKDIHQFYHLSNGNIYKNTELIIGLDNIRDIKIIEIQK